MNNKIVFLLISFSIWGFVFSSQIKSQEKINNDLTIEYLKEILGDSLIIENAISELYGDPETINTINKIWKDNVLAESRFLKDLNIEFKTFKVSNSDSSYGLGLGYAFNKDIARRKFSVESQSGLSLSLLARGNVAFEKNINPEDFLETSISFHLFKSWGGTIPATTEVYDRIKKLVPALASIEDKNEFLNSKKLREFEYIVKKYLRDQFYVDFSLLGNFESNQDFSTKQYTYGATLGVDIKFWQNEYFNVFDWPFAAIRWLSGYDDELAPIGGSFPTFLISLERVSPKSYESRETAGDNSDYTRINSEVTFKTPISSISFFEADLRFYKELNPTDEIKNAELDEYLFFTASLTSFGGVFISYTYGRLPFDISRNTTYQLGFRYNF